MEPYLYDLHKGRGERQQSNATIGIYSIYTAEA